MVVDAAGVYVGVSCMAVIVGAAAGEGVDGGCVIVGGERTAIDEPAGTAADGVAAAGPFSLTVERAGATVGVKTGDGSVPVGFDLSSAPTAAQLAHNNDAKQKKRNASFMISPLATNRCPANCRTSEASHHSRCCNREARTKHFGRRGDGG